MSWQRWLAGIVLALLPLAAHAQEHGTGGDAHGSGDPAKDYMNAMVGHTQDRPFGTEHAPEGWHPGPFELTNHRVMLLAAAGLVALLFFWLAARRRNAEPVPRGKLENLLDTFIVYVRDEIVRPNVPHYGDRLLPFFLTAFFFVLACNLLGMVPAPIGQGTATGNFAVTSALAIATLMVGTVGGMVAQGPVRYWVNLVPHGVPLPLAVLIIFPIEVIGLCVKHFALAVRLFANMIAGHIVIAAFIGLIFLFKTLAIAPVSVGVAVGISLLEVFVAFLQCYVFTLLSALFIGMALHPDH